MAIALDSTSTNGYAVGDVITWQHTCSGNNRVLLVGVSILSVVGASVSSITYGGQSLTLVRARASVSGAVRSELWRIIAPTTGANDVVVTLSDSLDNVCSAVSLTGAHQGSPTEGAADNSATNVGAADATVDVTTVYDSDWVVDVVSALDLTVSVGVGQTERQNVSGSLGSGGMSTEGPKSPAGAVTMNWTDIAGLVTWTTVASAIKPAVIPLVHSFRSGRSRAIYRM